AAARAARQAQAEDLEKVDIEHVEKVLPQLISSPHLSPHSDSYGHAGLLKLLA
ncbi:PREDICTED: centromere protein X, partial [Cariama cristata]|uniref:centromere protein X n=1 Tax=Cariama cristata TaxID=54380 RepID=UPI000520141F